MLLIIVVIGVLGWWGFIEQAKECDRERHLRQFWKSVADDNNVSSTEQTRKKWDDWFSD